jgi:hypothetical protein
LLRSIYASIIARDLNRNWVDFPVLEEHGLMRPRETNDPVSVTTEIEARLATEAQARSLALDHHIEMIVRTCTVEQVRQGSVAEAIDCIRELPKGNELSGLKIKDLMHEGHKY